MGDSRGGVATCASPHASGLSARASWADVVKAPDEHGTTAV